MNVDVLGYDDYTGNACSYQGSDIKYETFDSKGHSASEGYIVSVGVHEATSPHAADPKLDTALAIAYAYAFSGEMRPQGFLAVHVELFHCGIYYFRPVGTQGGYECRKLYDQMSETYLEGLESSAARLRLIVPDLDPRQLTVLLSGTKADRTDFLELLNKELPDCEIRSDNPSYAIARGAAFYAWLSLQDCQQCAYIFLVDRSYSMNSVIQVDSQTVSFMDIAKRILRQILDDIQPEDYKAGLCLFSDQDEVVMEPDTDMTSSQKRLSTFIDKIKPVEGAGNVQTFAAEALHQAVNKLERCQEEQKTIILISDGCFADEDQFLQEAAEAKAKGIRLLAYSIGKASDVGGHMKLDLFSKFVTVRDAHKQFFQFLKWDQILG